MFAMSVVEVEDGEFVFIVTIGDDAEKRIKKSVYVVWMPAEMEGCDGCK